MIIMTDDYLIERLKERMNALRRMTTNFMFFLISKHHVHDAFLSSSFRFSFGRVAHGQSGYEDDNNI